MLSSYSHRAVARAIESMSGDQQRHFFREALEAHEGWRVELLTFTPEFAPPDYMHTLPYTGAPVADLWDICLWMTERFLEQFEE